MPTSPLVSTSTTAPARGSTPRVPAASPRSPISYCGLLIYFDIAGIGGGFGLGVGPGVGIGSGGGVGLGEKKRRQIFSLEDLPELVRPQDPKRDEEVEGAGGRAHAAAGRRARADEAEGRRGRRRRRSCTSRGPVTPIGAGTDLGARFASTGAGAGGLGVGGGGGGGIGLSSLGISLDSAFGKYVGSLRKVGLDVALVIDSTGSMQMVIDDLKRRLDDLVVTMQRLVPDGAHRRRRLPRSRRRQDRDRAAPERGLPRQVDRPHLQGQQGEDVPRRHRRRGRRRLGGSGEGRLRGRHERSSSGGPRRRR